MHVDSRKTSLCILGITSLLSSRLFFVFVNDPEGPNLLIVTVLAVVLFVPSLVVYARSNTVSSFRRLLLPIMVQVVLVACLYFFLI